MVDSALVGYPPANDRDLAIIKGILSELPPALAGTWSPEKGTPPSPNWPPLDERNSDSKAGEIIASSVVAMFVLILITGTRLGARWTGKYNRMGWDDYFIIMAAVELLLPLVQLCVIANEAVLASLVVWISINLAQVNESSLGDRDYNSTYANKERYNNFSFVSSVFLPIVQGFTKLSIVCFNARLTGLTSMAWRWIHRAMFAFSLIFLVFWTIILTILTLPVGAGYSYIIAGRTPGRLLPGVKPFPLTLGFTLHHVLLDWILLSIPTFVIFRLQMSMTKKLRCVVPLLIGLLSCVGASYCAYFLFHAKTKDPSYEFIINLHWRHLDLLCGVLATSLPAIASLATHHFPRSWKKYHTSDRSTPNKLYVGDQSNPLSSTKKLTSFATANHQHADRDRYDELGPVGINVRHDIDLQSLQGSDKSEDRRRQASNNERILGESGHAV